MVGPLRPSPSSALRNRTVQAVSPIAGPALPMTARTPSFREPFLEPSVPVCGLNVNDDVVFVASSARAELTAPPGHQQQEQG